MEEETTTEQLVDLFLALLDAQSQINDVAAATEGTSMDCTVDGGLAHDWRKLADTINANMANIIAAMQTTYYDVIPQAQTLNERHLNELADCPDGKYCRAAVQARIALIERERDAE